jgi:hypothetical protein
MEDELVALEFEQKQNLTKTIANEIPQINKFIINAGKAQLMRYCHG